VQAVSDKAGEWLHDADVPDQVRNEESDVAGRLSEAGGDILTSARVVTAARMG
jgi:hypothetical protein